jgi:hypothetical protein
MFSQPQNPTLSEMVEEVEMAAIPSSSLPKIPQSVTRPSQGGTTRNPLLSAVHATPSRKTATQSSQSASGLLGVPPVDDGEYLLSSPLRPRRSSGQLFIPVPDSVAKTVRTTIIEETPVKKRAEAAQVHDRPGPTSGSDKENGRVGKVSNEQKGPNVGPSHEESIYKSLGWDDADDLDELL